MSLKSAMMILCFLPGVFNAALCHAATILDTAAPPSDTSGSLLYDDQWVLHRFELTATTQIESIGADFRNYSGAPVDIFGAIVHLTSYFDTPNSIDLTTPDVLETTLINVGTTPGLYTSPIDITLEPGWYALEFGTGAFSASNVNQLDLLMRAFGTDLDPAQSPIAAFQMDHTWRAGEYVEQGLATRFYVTGTVVPTPVPAAVWLFGSGLLAIAGLAQRSRARRSADR